MNLIRKTVQRLTGGNGALKTQENAPAPTVINNAATEQVMPIENMAENEKRLMGEFDLKDDAGAILVQIIRNIRSLYQKDVAHWIAARQEAITPQIPRRFLLYELYHDVNVDPFIFGLVQNRILRISNKNFKIVNTSGEMDDAKTDLLKKAWFTEFVKLAMESKLWGFSLPFIDKFEEGEIRSIKLLPREHVMPEWDLILQRPFDISGSNYTQRPLADWVIPIGKPDDLGLFEKCGIPWIMRKHSWQNWDEFEEIFGIPMRIAKTASTDARARAEMEKWLRELGRSAYAIMPPDSEIEIKESTRSDAYQVYFEKINAANAELAILVNGQTMTTMDGSSQSQAQVHQDTEDEITQDDKKFIHDLVNDILIPLLIRHGYPFTKQDRFVFDDARELLPTQKITIYKTISDMGYELDPEQLMTDFGIKIIGKKTPPPGLPGAPGKPQAEADKENEEGKPDKEEPEPDKQKPKNSVETNFNHALGCCSPGYRAELVNSNYGLSDEEVKLLRNIYDNPGQVHWDSNTFLEYNQKLVEASKTGFKGMSLDYDSRDPKTKAMMEASTHRFGADKTVRQVYELNNIRKDPALKSFAEYRERTLGLIANYKENWTRTEYDTGEAISLAGATYNRYMESKDAVPYWRFVDAGDSKVRPEHHRYNGMVFRKDDPASFAYMPPLDYGCRCDSEEVSDYEGDPNTFADAVNRDPDYYDKMKKNGFGINRGELEEIFTEAQSYLAGIADAPDFDYSSFNFEDAGLEALEKLQATLEEAPLKEGFDHEEAQAMYDKHKDKKSGMLRQMDITDNPVWLDENIFATAMHTDLDALQLMGDAMQGPDEVYFKEGHNRHYTRTYVKMYKDRTEVVEVEFNKNQPMTVKRMTSKGSDKDRAGLLIYKR